MGFVIGFPSLYVFEFFRNKMLGGRVGGCQRKMYVGLPGSGQSQQPPGGAHRQAIHVGGIRCGVPSGHLANCVKGLKNGHCL